MATRDLLEDRGRRLLERSARAGGVALARLRANRDRPWPDGDRSGIVFVVGSGRSGTHWMGYILDSHPDVRITIEQSDIFNCVTRMAMRPPERWFLLPRLVELYRRERLATGELWYADKSHPNIWLAEYLADAIPTARFIGIGRDPYQTVASMLAHAGVNDRPNEWRDVPVPNRFLGITEDDVEGYGALPPVEQHALRWNSHHARLHDLVGVLGDRYHLVAYDDLHARPTEELAAVQRFLGLTAPFPAPEVSTRSLDKWRATLTDDDVERIRRRTGVEPPA